jgi:hypothetical protein
MARVLTLFLIVVALAGGGYWYWTTTPGYAVLQIKDALKEHDVAKFNKYVDLDSVASNVIDVFVQTPMGIFDAFGPVGRIVGVGLVGFVKPQLVDAIKLEINQLILQGNLAKSQDSSEYKRTADARSFFMESSKEGNKLSVKKLIRQLGFSGKALRGVKYSNVEGKQATIGLTVYNAKYDTELVLDLRMHDMGGYWRVVQFSNLPQFIDEVMKLQMNNRPVEKARTAFPPAA